VCCLGLSVAAGLWYYVTLWRQDMNRHLYVRLNVLGFYLFLLLHRPLGYIFTLSCWSEVAIRLCVTAIPYANGPLSISRMTEEWRWKISGMKFKGKNWSPPWNTSPSATLPATNPTWSDVRPTVVFRSEKSAAYSVRYGTELYHLEYNTISCFCAPYLRVSWMY
jgi:hypothetical protein